MQLVMILLCLLLALPAQAQQPLPLSEWRAQIDPELAKLACQRDAHAQIMNILQIFERVAQQEKMAKLREQQDEAK
jgi:hypothetical protein